MNREPFVQGSCMRMSLNRSLSSSNKGLLEPKESQKEDTKRIRHKENTNARYGQTWPLTKPGDKQRCAVHLWRKASMEKITISTQRWANLVSFLLGFNHKSSVVKGTISHAIFQDHFIAHTVGYKRNPYWNDFMSNKCCRPPPFWAWDEQ